MINLVGFQYDTAKQYRRDVIGKTREVFAKMRVGPICGKATCGISRTFAGCRRVNLRLNPKKIDTKSFLTDFGRNCGVKYHTESLPDSDLGKGVISKMASNMGVTILQYLYFNNYSI